MSSSNANSTETLGLDAAESTRLPRADRRDALLDAAVAILAAGDVEAVSMEAVAERAGVSRPLVYKHFANRSELLAAVYQREAALLNAELTADVVAADTVEGMFRALIHGALQAQGKRGAALAHLRAAGLRSARGLEERRRQDSSTLTYFTRQAAKQFGLEERQARAAVAMLLGVIQTVLARWRLKPTPENAALLEETYVALVVGGLERLAHQD